MVMINSEKDIKHKGLRQLFLTDNSKDLPADQIDRLKNVLFLMSETTTLDVFRNRPGSRLHQLKGDLQGLWSVTITGNYRLIFSFENGYFSDIDYIDYH